MGSSVLDEREVLAMQFSCCHSFVVGNDLVGHSATPTQWCRLKALHQQVTMGPCNLPPPPPTELENRALWREWQQLGSMGTEEAEYAFVEQVLQLCEPIDHDPSVVAFLREFDGLSTSTKADLESPLRSATDPSKSSSTRRPSALDVKTTLATLVEDIVVLNANAREDAKHMGMAIQADVTIEERKMEARDQRSNVEELTGQVQQLIKQLDSDIVAALSRRKWSYEQIESQCEDLLARCETCSNTYKNQIYLTTPSTSIRLGYFTTLLVPLAAGLSYWWYRKRTKR